MIQKDIDESAASRAILGVSYRELGRGIARAWKFPDKIVGSMKGLPQGRIDGAKTGVAMLRHLSAFSNSLCSIASNSEGVDREKALADLLKRFEKSIPLTKDQISKLLDSAREKVEGYSGTLNINTAKSRFLRSLTGYSKESEMEVRSVKKGFSSIEKAETTQSFQFRALEIEETAFQPEDTRDAQSILINGIQEITNALLEECYDINHVLTMILETMYRGFGFHRVFLCLADPRQAQIHARFGFGENIEKIIGGFSFKMQRAPDVFNIALAQTTDLGIDDSSDPRIMKGIPEWYRRLVAAPAFVLFPVLINKKPLGLIYADKDRKGRVIDGSQLQYMKILCNQAVLAIKQMTLRS